jgi:hypothetical protein
MKKILLSILVVLAMTSTVFAKDYTLGDIEYGVTAENLCAALQDGDTLTIISGGGDVSESRRLAICVNQTDVLVKLRVAYSAATLVTMAANKVCFGPSAELGYHVPHYVRRDGTTKELSMKKLRKSMAWNMKYMKEFGYTTEQAMFITGVTVMTPPDQIYVLPTNMAVKLLGKRYIGVCKMSAKRRQSN